MGDVKLKFGSTLRQKILGFVGALALLSLLGSTLSLFRITEVERSLDAINRVFIPLGRLLSQIQSDADIFQRELDRRLGYSHWQDPNWRPRPLPKWIEEVLESEISRAQVLVSREGLPWMAPGVQENWKKWLEELSSEFISLRTEAFHLFVALEKKDEEGASQIYPRWVSSLEGWKRQLHWGVNEYEKTLRQAFSKTENRVSELKTALQTILGVVIALSLLLLWLGERALRPLSELTGIVRDIARRGLRKEDKSLLPALSMSRNDEVSNLTREFHRMATTLLEREKTVESQKKSLEEHNHLLREIGSLNENILNSIDSILIVTDESGKIKLCNPKASHWLSQSPRDILGTALLSWELISKFPQSESWLQQTIQNSEPHKIEPHSLRGRVYGGAFLPLKQSDSKPTGAILILKDLTDELALEERLRQAENLAAVGKMSAQVAHEVRNPLHSIGLEAELALDVVEKSQDLNFKSSLKNSFQSILASSERLDKIIENYLRLSRLSSGKKTGVDLRSVLETVLATYAPHCADQGIKVEWTLDSKFTNASVWGDKDLLEYSLGNLMRNALQALEGRDSPRIAWTLKNLAGGNVWIQIEDNGPGVPPEILPQLFSPFVTSKAQGTGLGLSFVKNVIGDHEGQIDYKTGEEGAGACFEILLPVQSKTEVEA